MPSFLQKTSVRYFLMGLVMSGVGYGVFFAGYPVWNEFNHSFAMKEFREYGVFGTYEHHFFSFLGQVHKLTGLEKENEALYEQVAELEKKTTLLEGSHTERELASLNQTLEKKNKEESGAATAILLENIEYEVPEHVSNAGIYALTLGYFKKHEYEKVVVLFDYLFHSKDGQEFLRGENYALNGIAWAHLKNYQEAENNFKLAKKNSLPKSETYRSAMVWEAVITKAKGQSQVTQAKLLKFLELYPHSREGQMMNSERQPAGTTPAHSKEAEAHHE